MDHDHRPRASRRRLLIGAGALLGGGMPAVAVPLAGSPGCADAAGDGVVAVFAQFEVLPGQEARVSELTKALSSASRAEPGCILFLPYRFADDLGRYHIHEVYRDGAAFRAHTAADHTKAFNQALESAVYSGASSVSHLVGL